MTTSFTGMRMTKFSPYINKDLFSLDKAGIMEVVPGMSDECINCNPYMQSLDLTDIKRYGIWSDSKGNYVATEYYKVEDTDWIDYPSTYNNNTILAHDNLGNTITLGDFLVNVKDIGIFVNNSSIFSKNQSAPSKGIPAEIYSNMRTLAGYILQIKKYIKEKYKNKFNIKISSGWRDKYTENGRGSFHHVGCAVDFEVTNDDKDSTKLQDIFDYIVKNGDVKEDKTREYTISPKTIFNITELFFENQGANASHPIIHYAFSFQANKQCIRKFTDEFGKVYNNITKEITCT
jgi:hypothetical protein